MTDRETPPDELDDLLDAALGRAYAHADEPLTLHITLQESEPVDAADLVPAPTPLADALEQSGRYRIRGELGRGGMGLVLEAEDRHLGRRVAIKVLHEAVSHSARRSRRFVEEAQIAGQLHHPAIIPVHDVGLVEGRVYFTMKLVSGETLGEALRRGAPIDVASVFARICEAVAYAHSRCVVHRDLKPSNVMLGGFGEVLVMDWGLAKVLGADDDTEDVRTVRTSSPVDASVEGSIKGTPAYMSPEQAAGRAVDPRSDVFSLGAILAHALTGRPPYEGRDSREVRQAAAAGDLAAAEARLRSSGADPTLVELALSCLALDRDRRPADAGVVATRVADYRRDVAERARQAELQAARAEQERRVRILSIAVALLVIAAIVGFVVVQRNREERARRAAGEVATETSEVDRLQGEASTGSPERRLAILEKAKAHAQRALTAARSGDADAATQELARRKLAAVEADISRARADRSKQARDDAMLASLRELRLDRGRNRFAEEIVDASIEVFAGYGIRLDAPPAEVEAVIRESAIFEELVQGLHEWTLVSYAGESEKGDWRRIAALAARVDPNRRRSELLLEAFEKRRADGRYGGDETSDLPVATLSLLSRLVGEQHGAEHAIGMLRDAHGRFPDDFWINHDLGYWHWSLGQMHDAVRYYHAAAALETTSSLAEMNLAIALGSLGRHEEALKHARSAVRKNPKSWNAQNILGVELTWLGKYEEALAAHLEALRLGPRRLDAVRGVADMYSRLGRVHEALRRFEEGLKIFPQDAYLHVGRGMCLKRLRRFDEAAAAFRAGTKHDPRYVTAWFGLGSLIARTNPAGAIECYDRTLELEPRKVDAWFNRGNASQRSGDLDGAIADLRKAVAIAPDHAGAHANLGIFLRARGDFVDGHHHMVRARDTEAKWRPLGIDIGRYVADAERDRDLDLAADRLLRGETDVPSNSEVDAMADLHVSVGRHRKAARLWDAAFRRREPWDAAGRAAEAACRTAADPNVEDGARAVWRRRAVTWLRARVVRLAKDLAADRMDADDVESEVEGWEDSAELEAVRPDATGSPDEKTARAALWKAVDELMNGI